MDWTIFTGLLAIITFAIAIGFALNSKRKVDKRLDDKNAKKSTLAKDKDSKGDPADV